MEIPMTDRKDLSPEALAAMEVVERRDLTAEETALVQGALIASSEIAYEISDLPSHLTINGERWVRAGDLHADHQELMRINNGLRDLILRAREHVPEGSHLRILIDAAVPVSEITHMMKQKFE
jgi:hypothetical protein